MWHDCFTNNGKGDVMKHIRMDALVEIAKKSPGDIGFIKDHLTLKNREIFTSILNEEAIKEVKVKKKKTKINKPFGLITVFDEPKLAAELAYIIAKGSPNHDVAILDADRFDPRLDIYLNSRSYIKSVHTHLDFRRTTGLNLLIDACHKHTLTKQYAKHLAIKVLGCRNLYYFSGSYMLEDYEYFRIDDFIRVIGFLKQHYDTVLITANKFLYDAFTIQSLLLSDCNLIGLSGSLSDIKEKKTYMDFLEDKQHIEKRKSINLLFDYKKNFHIDKAIVEVFMQEKLMVLPYHSLRHAGVRSYPYLKKIKSHQLRHHNKLLKKIRQVCDEFS